MRNWLKKKWVWATIGAVLIGAVAGVGFVPVTRAHTEAYPCTVTEQYACTETEGYPCTKVRHVPCPQQDSYTYYVEVPYTVTKEQNLQYSAIGSASESWWDCDIWITVQIRNEDTEGGYFEVIFKYYNGVAWYSKSQTKYIKPAESAEFKVEFGHGCGTPWDWSYNTVPPTKTILVTEVRLEERTGVREYTGTCDEVYEATCTREYDATCTREVPGTCYREEKENEWLYWPKP